VYTQDRAFATVDSRRYRGVSYITLIDAAKEAVPVIDLADRLTGPGGLRRIGREWVGHCVIPDHEDRTPSFTVNPEKNVWFCHGCLQGGEVVALARLAWGYDQRDAHTAAAMLLMEFGYEVPQRPPAWYRKQERQRPVRDAMEAALLRRQQRRIFAILWREVGPDVAEEERTAEVEAIWDEALHIARLLIAERRAS
jgi:hypothetical protein